MITLEEFGRFVKLREDLFDVIALVVSRGGGGKSFEGTFRIQYPGYETRDQEPWGVFLDCYLVGPSRHYGWWGSTFTEALSRAETDIRAWMHEAQEDDE